MSRYISAIVSAILMFAFTNFLVGLLVMFLWPPATHMVVIGLSPDWRNVPGFILGSLAATHSARASLRKRTRNQHETNDPESTHH